MTRMTVLDWIARRERESNLKMPADACARAVAMATDPVDEATFIYLRHRALSQVDRDISREDYEAGRAIARQQMPVRDAFWEDLAWFA